MKAITIKQPWAWAIVHGSKRVENRTWKPSLKLIGQRFAIHAAKVDDHNGAFMDVTELCFLSTPLRGAYCHHSAIVGTARLVRVVDECDFDLGDWFNDGNEAWFSGPKGFILDDVIKCEPFACKGALGFWEAPAEFVDPWRGAA